MSTRKTLTALAALAVGGVTAAIAVEAHAAAGCRVTYAVTNQWQGGR
jgi:endoglucanase